MFFSLGASPRAYKYIARNTFDSSFVITPDPKTIYVEALDNAIYLAAWTLSGNLLIPERETIPLNGGWGDSLITVPAGGYAKLEFNGKTHVRLRLKTANWYSTTDSNSTAVTIEVN